MVIKEVEDIYEVKEKTGPRKPHSIKAQSAFDEFVESGLVACEVDWKDIDEDFDRAKTFLAARIEPTKTKFGDKRAGDIVTKTNRAKQKIYLVHKDQMGQ